MRVLDIKGTVRGSRRFTSGSDALSDEEVKEPSRLARLLKSLFRRVADIEAKLGPEATEFTKDVAAAGASVTMEHGYNSPVRWHVVYWGKTETGAAPVAGPSLVADAASTPNMLILKSYVAGRAIIRVEPSQW